MMNEVRVEIDLNSCDADGLTRTRLRNVSGEVRVGQIVTAFESEDEVQAIALVTRIDEKRGYVFLAVNWDSMRDDDGSPASAQMFSASSVNRAQAKVANAFSANAGAAAAVSYSYFRSAQVTA
jgi:ribosomal protein S28E/S33